jgi:hypothetical protein
MKKVENSTQNTRVAAASRRAAMAPPALAAGAGTLAGADSP